MPTSLVDLVLLRRAINQDRPVSAPVRQAIVDELGEGLESNNVRPTISIVPTFIATDVELGAPASGVAAARGESQGTAQNEKSPGNRGLCEKSRKQAT